VNLSPGSLAFGNQGVSTTSAAQTVTLSNPGTAALAISSIGITGTGAADFAISANTCGSTLAVAGSCTISVIFTPASVANFSATLSVADNVTGSPQTVALSGAGTAAQAVLTPATLSFPSTTVGVSSAALTTVLSNPGTAPLTISAVTLGGANAADFTLTNGCSSTLAAGASCNLSVTFTPASAANFAATISVADNVSGSPQTVALTGTGTAAPVPLATLTPATLAFGNQNVATTSAAQTLTLSNAGTAALTITGITLGGANPTAFTQSASTCGATLAAGASCAVSYTFTPGSAGNFAATVSVADNAAGSPQTAALSGTGIAAGDFSLSGSPSTAAVNPGGAASFTINVAGLGGGFGLPVTLSVTGLPQGALASFAPASVTPGSESGSSVLTVQTSQIFGAVRSSRGPSATWLAFGMLPCLAALWFRLRRRGRGHRRAMPWLAALALLTVSLGLSSCSGGYFGPPPQSFTLTVAGTSNSTQHSTTVTLTVQ
jgi:hypothetical protein